MKTITSRQVEAREHVSSSFASGGTILKMGSAVLGSRKKSPGGERRVARQNLAKQDVF